MEFSKSIPLKKKRYLLRDSDRSGFTYKNVELVLDNGSLVGGDEFDNPPPSNRLVPAEGDISPGDTRQDYTSYGTVSDQATLVQYVNTASTINLNRQVDNAGQYTHMKSIVYVCGSLNTIALNSDLQITASNHGDFLTVQGVGSSVVLKTGSGLRLYTGIIKLDSGTQLNLIYDATNGLWCETSRIGQNFSLLGAY